MPDGAKLSLVLQNNMDGTMDALKVIVLAKPIPTKDAMKLFVGENVQAPVFRPGPWAVKKTFQTLMDRLKCLMEAALPSSDHAGAPMKVALSLYRLASSMPCQVRGSGLFDKVNRNSVIFPDGAKAWVKVSKEVRRNLKLAPVCHNRQEFVAKDARAKAMGASRIRGTQTLDRRWDGLDEWIGTHVSTLVNGRPNPLLWQRVKSYQWRVKQRDVYKSLGEACK